MKTEREKIAEKNNKNQPKISVKYILYIYISYASERKKKDSLALSVPSEFFSANKRTRAYHSINKSNKMKI